MASVGLKPETPQRRAPLPSEPMRRSYAGGPVEAAPAPPPLNYDSTPYQPPTAAVAPVRQAGLPEPISREEPTRPTFEPIARGGRSMPERAPVGSPARHAVSGSSTIDVAPGDTLYGLAKRHNVSISELMSANGLQGPMIKPGQKLVVPPPQRRAPARRREIVATAPAPAPVPARRDAAERNERPPHLEPAPRAVHPDQAPSDWTGTHTITARDSLYAIAKRYGAKVADLQAVNGITDPGRLRAGAVLKVPGVPGGVRQAEIATNQPAAVPPAVAREAQAELSSGPVPRPRIINAGSDEAPAEIEPPERVAVASPKSPVINDASPAPRTAKPQSAALPGKFRWPAKGRIVASFGPRQDNTHNDGINILVPQGTSVVAAESGTVAYAGSELKGYGNLVLIRHEGNWVTAYAHNETLLVRRGDRVERGQEIAKAGKTGAVDQPQVHFELRQGSKPVDPLPHLER
jgi:murein DD-endopeptidase MepM/ murein hydrolase activator NlpD